MNKEKNLAENVKKPKPTFDFETMINTMIKTPKALMCGVFKAWLVGTVQKKKE